MAMTVIVGPEQKRISRRLLGFYPVHFVAWADMLDDSLGYENSQLSQFLRRLADSVGKGEVKEERNIWIEEPIGSVDANEYRKEYLGDWDIQEEGEDD